MISQAPLVELVVTYDRDEPPYPDNYAVFITESGLPRTEAQQARAHHISLANELRALANSSGGQSFERVSHDANYCFDLSSLGLDPHNVHEVAFSLVTATSLAAFIKGGKDILIQMLKNRARRPLIVLRIGKTMVRAHNAGELEEALELAEKFAAKEERRKQATTARRPKKDKKASKAAKRS